MADDADWSMLPELMSPGPPFDGAPVRLRLVSLTEIEARFAEPRVAASDPSDTRASQKGWVLADGRQLPEHDPPRFWRPA